MQTRFDDWVTAHLAEFETARRYVRNHGTEALRVLSSDASRMGTDEFREVVDAIPYAVLEEAAERLGSYLRWDTIAHDVQVQTVFERFGGVHNPAAVSSLDRLFYWHLLAHAKSGKWVYEVSSALGQQLRHTDLRSLTCDNLRLPYPAVLLLVPNAADLMLSSPSYQPHRVTEIYIVEEPPPNRCWRLLILGRAMETEVKRCVPLWLAEGGSIDDAIARSNASMENSGQALVVSRTMLGQNSSLMPEAERVAMLAGWEPVFRWTMNAIIYATNDEERHEVWQNKDAKQLRDRIAKLVPGPKKDDLRRRLKALDPQRRIILGPNAKPLDVAPSGDGYPLLVRTLVQGHWKHQPFGPARSERKLIFIKPYWRGPDDAPAAEGGIHRLV